MIILYFKQLFQENKLNENIHFLENKIVELKKKLKNENLFWEKEQKFQTEIKNLKKQLDEQLDKNKTYESSFGPKLAQVNQKLIKMCQIIKKIFF